MDGSVEPLPLVSFTPPHPTLCGPLAVLSPRLKSPEVSRGHWSVKNLKTQHLRHLLAFQINPSVLYRGSIQRTPGPPPAHHQTFSSFHGDSPRVLSAALRLSASEALLTVEASRVAALCMTIPASTKAMAQDNALYGRGLMSSKAIDLPPSF